MGNMGVIWGMRFTATRARRDTLVRKILWDEAIPSDAEIVKMVHLARDLDRQLAEMRQEAEAAGQEIAGPAP